MLTAICKHLEWQCQPTFPAATLYPCPTVNRPIHSPPFDGPLQTTSMSATTYLETQTGSRLAQSMMPISVHRDLMRMDLTDEVDLETASQTLHTMIRQDSGSLPGSPHSSVVRAGSRKGKAIFWVRILYLSADANPSHWHSRKRGNSWNKRSWVFYGLVEDAGGHWQPAAERTMSSPGNSSRCSSGARILSHRPS